MRFLRGILLFPVFCFSFLWAQDIEFKSPELLYQELKELKDYWINSPIIMEDRIIFFYKGEVNEVIVAGDFNGWRTDLKMERIDTNSYVYQAVYDQKLKAGTYRYKYMIDRIWTEDPYNTNFILDQSGQKVSVFQLKNDLISEKTSPLWIEDQVYEFRYRNIEAANVSLVGDFNNWNPYSHILKDNSAGEFTVRVKLQPGLHVYCLVVDGQWIPDPNNFKQYIDNIGTFVNVVYIVDHDENKLKPMRVDQ